jgi:hypothetical protein
MKINVVIFTAILTVIFSTPVNAHKPSDSYLTLKKHETDSSLIDAKWDISLRDLNFAIGLDDNNDGSITWGELKKHHSQISDYALSSLKFKTENSYCSYENTEHLVDNHSDGAYDTIHFFIKCPSEKRPLKFDIEYTLFFDLDPSHRGLLNIKHKDKTLTAVFSPEKFVQHFDLEKFNPWNQFIEFIKEGIWHIWIGFDHILFLLALLLPSVFIRTNNKWDSVTDFKAAFWNVFKIVTAFTVAHSMTLSIAALEIIKLPSRLVESAIAASVVLAALNNIFPLFKKGRWVIAFLFGLIHGFGFASVLMDLGLEKETLLIPLVSFNVGVELGQLAIVSVFLPFAYSLKDNFIYKKIIMLIGSLIIMLIALSWFIERFFNLSFIPF